MLSAVTDVVAEIGFGRATVAHVLEAASVSRATFYQYFSDVADCFLTAYREHASSLLRQIETAVPLRDDRELAVVEVLLRTAAERPAEALVLFREGLAAGPAGLRERDALVGAIESAMAAPHGVRKVDLPPTALIGGVLRFLAMRLTERAVRDSIAQELCQWLEAFSLPPGSVGWSASFMPTLPDAHYSGVFPSDRPQGSARERILRATAVLVAARGYGGVSVSDVVETAGVSRRLFYRHFGNKEDAFVAAYEDMFARTIAVCTPAFFAPGTWRERVWQAALAFTGFFSREPLVASIGFVECYALGAPFARRVHDTQLAFTLFLEDGYRERPQAEVLSRSCGSLAAATIFEAAFQVSRRGLARHIRPLQPFAVFASLTPFIGSQEAGEFVSGKLSVPAF